MRTSCPVRAFRAALFFVCFVCFVVPLRAAEPTYWQDVRPVLRKHCTVCHSKRNLDEVEVSGGLALDSYEAILKGAKAADLPAVMRLGLRLQPLEVGLPERLALARQHETLYQFLLNKWYFDEIYDALLVRPTIWLGRILWKYGDGWLIDGFGPDGISARVLDVTRNVMRLQSGYLYHYAFAMLIGVAALITWFIVSTAGAG